jgi:uncharacterized protein
MITMAILMEMDAIKGMLEELAQDNTVPKNIRLAVENARKGLDNENQDIAVRINHAISTLDEVSNDPNIPVYSRTQIWNVVSMLEVENEKNK